MIDVKVSGKTVRKNKLKYLDKTEKNMIYHDKNPKSFKNKDERQFSK